MPPAEMPPAEMFPVSCWGVSGIAAGCVYHSRFGWGICQRKGLTRWVSLLGRKRRLIPRSYPEKGPMVEFQLPFSASDHGGRGDGITAITSHYQYLTGEVSWEANHKEHREHKRRWLLRRGRLSQRAWAFGGLRRWHPYRGAGLRGNGIRWCRSAHHRRHTGRHPASSWACLADAILRGILTVEGTHPMGEPSESRAHGSFPSPYQKEALWSRFNLRF